MIKAISLENVRVFEGPGWKFPFAPLTVLCGTNSAGKSTVLKIPLLLRRNMMPTGGAADGRLRLTGSQYDFGDFESFISHNETERELSIGVTIEDEMPLEIFKLLRQIKYGRRKQRGKPVKEDLLPYFLEVSFRFCSTSSDSKKSRMPRGSKRKALRPLPPAAQGVLRSASFKIKVDDEILLEWRVLRRRKPAGDARYDIEIEHKYLRATMGVAAIKFGPQNRGSVRIPTVLYGILPELLQPTFKKTASALTHPEARNKLSPNCPKSRQKYDRRVWWIKDVVRSDIMIAR